MKRTTNWVFGTLAYLAAFSSNADDHVTPRLLDYGVAAGLSTATLVGSDASPPGKVDKKRRAGLTLSGFATFDVDHAYKLRTELLFVQKGTTYQTPTVDVTYKYNYIEAPLLMQFDRTYRGKAVYFVGGGYLAWLVAAGADTSAGFFDFRDTTKTLDFGLELGTGVTITDKVTTDVRYALGLTEFDHSILTPRLNWRHSNLRLSVGYQF